MAAPTVPPQIQALIRAIEGVPVCHVCNTPRRHDCDGDCDPDAWCACCLGCCDCPPMPGHWWCRHLIERAARVDLSLFTRLLLAAAPTLYADRPIPVDVILSANPAERIKVMRRRAANRESVFGPGDVVDVDRLSRLALQFARRRNGSDYVESVTTESEVRRAV